MKFTKKKNRINKKIKKIANEMNSIGNPKVIMHDIYEKEIAFNDIKLVQNNYNALIYGEKFT